MSEIIKYVIIIIEGLYNITAECVISIGYWVASYIFIKIIIIFIINLIINNKNRLKKLLYIIFSITVFICIMLINITTAGEDDISYIMTQDPLDNHITHLDNMPDKLLDVHDITYSDYIWDENNINYSKNITYMAGNTGWELCLSADSARKPINLNNPINHVFTSNIPGFQNQTITNQDLYNTFKKTIETHSMANWNKLDKSKYTRIYVLNVANFEHLRQGIYGVKLKNPHLDLKWWNLCYLYGISHHEDIPFNVDDILNHTPESFYNHLRTLRDENLLNNFWKRELEKYSNRPDVFYTYMRIIHSVFSRRT